MINYFAEDLSGTKRGILEKDETGRLHPFTKTNLPLSYFLFRAFLAVINLLFQFGLPTFSTIAVFFDKSKK